MLAVATLAVAGFALLKPIAPPPVPDSIARYTPAPQPTVEPAPTVSQAADLLEANPDKEWTLAVLGDSTGNEAGEWVDLVARDLGARYDRPVIMHFWDDKALAYQAPQQVVSGSHAAINVWDGSAPGRSADYSREKLNDLLPVKADLLIINHGHNHQTPSAAVASIRSLIFTAGLRHGPTATAVTIQNPWQQPTASSNGVQDAIRKSFTGSEFPVIDVMGAFKSAPNVAALMKDNIHPNPAGSRVWADVVLSSAF